MLSKYSIMLSLLGFVILTFSLVSTVYSIEPKKENYEHILSSNIPNYLKIVDYNIEAEDQIGSKVDPIWVTRFNASIEPIENLYISNGDKNLFGGIIPKEYDIPQDLFDNINIFNPKPKYRRVYFLDIKSLKNVPFKIYGKTSTKIYQGKLKIEFLFDGDPLNKYTIGEPFSSFNQDHGYIITGSDQEKKFNELIKKYNEDAQIKKNEEEKEAMKQHQIRISHAEKTITNGFYSTYEGHPIKFFPNNIFAYSEHSWTRNIIGLYEWKLNHDKIILKFIDCIDVNKRHGKYDNIRNDSCYKRNNTTTTLDIIDVGTDWFEIKKTPPTSSNHPQDIIKLRGKIIKFNNDKLQERMDNMVYLVQNYPNISSPTTDTSSNSSTVEHKKSILPKTNGNNEFTYEKKQGVDGQKIFTPGQIWRGYYVCAQGRTSLNLKVVDSAQNQVTAIFDFNFNNGSAVGQFYLHGNYSPQSRELVFKPGKWIYNPNNYGTVGMVGQLSSDNKIYQGIISHSKCGEFSVSLDDKAL